MEKRNFAFDRMNFILIAACMAIVIVGFMLMAGPGSTETTYNPDIFSTRRSVVGPMISFFGFLFMVFAIMYKPKKRTEA